MWILISRILPLHSIYIYISKHVIHDRYIQILSIKINKKKRVIPSSCFIKERKRRNSRGINDWNPLSSFSPISLWGILHSTIFSIHSGEWPTCLQQISSPFCFQSVFWISPIPNIPALLCYEYCFYLYNYSYPGWQCLFCFDELLQL